MVSSHLIQLHKQSHTNDAFRCSHEPTALNRGSDAQRGSTCSEVWRCRRRGGGQQQQQQRGDHSLRVAQFHRQLQRHDRLAVRDTQLATTLGSIGIGQYAAAVCHLESVRGRRVQPAAHHAHHKQGELRRRSPLSRHHRRHLIVGVQRLDNIISSVAVTTSSSKQSSTLLLARNSETSATAAAATRRASQCDKCGRLERKQLELGDTTLLQSRSGLLPVSAEHRSHRHHPLLSQT